MREITFLITLNFVEIFNETIRTIISSWYLLTF